MSKTRKLVIVGDGEFAGIAHEYFTHDSPYEVAGFAVERPYRKQDEYCGLPVVDFEEIESRFPPQVHDAYVAITYTQLNRVRARLYEAVKAKGFRAANYVSSRAFVWRNVELGDNVFIFEHNVIQHHASIGSDVVLWSGNHIGHRCVIEPHCYISSHVVVSGYCRVGASSRQQHAGRPGGCRARLLHRRGLPDPEGHGAGKSLLRPARRSGQSRQPALHGREGWGVKDEQ